MEENKKDDVMFSQEDIDNINKDIENAKQALGTNDTKKQESNVNIDELTKQIEARILANLKAESEKKQEQEQKLSLEQELERQKQLAKEQLDALTAKVDELQTSKGVVSVKSPFMGDKTSYEDLIKDEERLKAIDAASREEFFKQRG